jgi:hypothetical protein
MSDIDPELTRVVDERINWINAVVDLTRKHGWAGPARRQRTRGRARSGGCCSCCWPPTQPEPRGLSAGLQRRPTRKTLFSGEGSSQAAPPSCVGVHPTP